jgi:hypothetical protein
MKIDPFFKDTPRKTMDMEGESFEFPILYYDLRAITAIFTAKTNKLKDLLPHPNFKPIELWPGTGMVGIVAFEYHDTSIGPYNEIGIAIPVKFPPGPVIPFFSAFPMMFKYRYSVYIRHLPVTTDIAYKGGVYFYNYPKFISEITFQDQNEELEVILKEKGELILKLRGKKLKLNKSAGFEYHTYSNKDNVVMHALVEGIAPRFGTMMMGNMAELELGDHRISKELARLSLSKNARSGTYAEGMMTKLHDPDTKWDAETLKTIVD